jgi:galactokinase
VNLIGEHTDYNNGYVLPMAVNQGIGICGEERTDGKVVLYSADFQEQVEFETTRLQKDPRHSWADYFKGVLQQYLKAGGKCPGCRAVLKGDLPRGAGLSSSAALEVATAVFLEKMRGSVWHDLELVKAAQAAENQFVGVNCGIMDPFASFLGRENDALLLDCRDLAYQWVPIPPNVKIIVCNTGIKRALSNSAYNQRRQECQAALHLLSSKLPYVHSLRDLSASDFERHQELLPETLLKRCRHVVSENQRVLDMVRALEQGDLITAGTLMAQSHESLRDDYEVSCTELDILTSIAQQNDSVYGARMMGGGFGGCTVNLVREDGAEAFLLEMAKEYKKKTGRVLESYVFKAASGAKFFE